MNRLQEGMILQSWLKKYMSFGLGVGCREYATVIKKENKTNIQRTEVDK